VCSLFRSSHTAHLQSGTAGGLSDDDDPIVFYTPPGKKGRFEKDGSAEAAAPKQQPQPAAATSEMSTWADGVGFKLLTVSIDGRDGEVANRNAISIRDIFQVTPSCACECSLLYPL
jgi:hypothetical protein